jgi:hypothetical protein
VALSPSQAAKLARVLRDLGESTWPDQELTQAQLARALRSEGWVAAATVGFWESATSPKTPSVAGISGSARFFYTERLLAGEPHSRAADQLTDAEVDRLRLLESNLTPLFDRENRNVRCSFQGNPFQLRVPVVGNQKLSPDLQNPSARRRLYEPSANPGGRP